MQLRVWRSSWQFKSRQNVEDQWLRVTCSWKSPRSPRRESVESVEGDEKWEWFRMMRLTSFAADSRVDLKGTMGTYRHLFSTHPSKRLKQIMLWLPLFTWGLGTTLVCAFVPNNVEELRRKGLTNTVVVHLADHVPYPVEVDWREISEHSHLSLQQNLEYNWMEYQQVYSLLSIHLQFHVERSGASWGFTRSCQLEQLSVAHAKGQRISWTTLIRKTWWQSVMCIAAGICNARMLILFYLDLWGAKSWWQKSAGFPIHAIFISNLLGNHLHTAGTNMCDGKWCDWKPMIVVTVVTVCHCSPKSVWPTEAPWVQFWSRFKTLSCNRLRVWSLLASFAWTPPLPLAGVSLWDGVLHILFQGISAHLSTCICQLQ